MTRRTEPREADTQRLILDWLAAKGIWHMRLNTGAMSGSHKGKKWFVRFGKPGMADILTAGYDECMDCGGGSVIYWIEVKTDKGTQSEEQKAFEMEVREAGMSYILARSLEDVTKILG